MATAAHNVFLDRTFRTMWSYVDLLRGRWWAHTDRPDTGHREHASIVGAISRRDSARARRLAEEHVARAWRSIAHKFEDKVEDAASPAAHVKSRRGQRRTSGKRPASTASSV